MITSSSSPSTSSILPHAAPLRLCDPASSHAQSGGFGSTGGAPTPAPAPAPRVGWSATIPAASLTWWSVRSRPGADGMLCAMHCRSCAHLKLVGPVIVFLPPPMVSRPRPVANAGSVVCSDGHTTVARACAIGGVPTDPSSIARGACLSCGALSPGRTPSSASRQSSSWPIDERAYSTRLGRAAAGRRFSAPRWRLRASWPYRSASVTPCLRSRWPTPDGPPDVSASAAAAASASTSVVASCASHIE